MNLWNRLFGARSSASRPVRPGRIALGCEALEGRDLKSASPLPVLLVIADQQDFYFKEYNDTRNAVLGQGVGVVVAATTTNTAIPHPDSGQNEAGVSGAVTPEIALANVDPANYSAIAFVGGWGSSMYQYAYNDPNGDGVTDNFYWHSAYNGDANLSDGVIALQKVVVNQLINDFLAADKPVAAICHGVTVLAWARVDGVSPLAGRQVSVPLTVGSPNQNYGGDELVYPSYASQYNQVVANGGLAIPISGARGPTSSVSDDVVVDGRIITAENYDSSTYFGFVIAQEVLANLPPALQAPTVTAVSHIIGPTTGGVLVTITGTNFQSITAVNVAGVPLAPASYDIVSATQITAIMPAHAAGAVDIVVVNAAGSGSLAGNSDFTYARPAVASVVIGGGPAIALGASGTLVDLAGQQSVVKQIRVAFNQPVSVAPDAFTLTPRNVTISGGALPATAPVTTSTTMLSPSECLVTFVDDGIGVHPGGILRSGVYDLTALASRISANGDTMAANHTTAVLALFGTLDGNNTYSTVPGASSASVDPGCLFALSDTFGSNVGDARYAVAFDANLDGAIDPADLFAFSDTFGATWTF